MKVLFADGNCSIYQMRDYSDRPWGPAFTEKCKASLLERLSRLGQYAGQPGQDLRHFNGNHATGAGRNPGAKAVKIIEEWVE